MRKKQFFSNHSLTEISTDLSSRLWKNLHPLPQNEKLVHTYYLKGDRSNSFSDFKHFLKTYLMRKKTIGKTLWFSKMEIFIAPGQKGWFIQLSTVGHLSLVTEKYFETMWEFPGDRLITRLQRHGKKTFATTKSVKCGILSARWQNPKQLFYHIFFVLLWIESSFSSDTKKNSPTTKLSQPTKFSSQ